MPTDGGRADGPVLYLDSTDQVGGVGRLCTDVFDQEEDEDYRVVLLTTSQSLSYLAEEWDVIVEDVRSPSEGAVIVASPQWEGKIEMTCLDGDVPLHAVRVDPEDLTGISMTFSRLVEFWGEGTSGLNICLQDIESLLTYHDKDTVYRFLNTVLATLRGAGAVIHAHVYPEAVDEQTLELLKSLFDRAIEEPLRESGATSTGNRRSPAGDTSAETEKADDADVDLDVDGINTVTTMSSEETDAFLGSQGNGVLAFGGGTPYAIPMSYGYDPDTREVYVHLSSFEGSEKQARLENSDRVALVPSRYERPDQWKSVVAEGSISRLSDAEVRDRNVLGAFADADLASVNVFGRPLSEVDFDWYVIEPSEITGRKALGEDI